MPHNCRGQHHECGKCHNGCGYYGGHGEYCHSGGCCSWHDGPRGRSCYGYDYGDHEEKANVPEPGNFSEDEPANNDMTASAVKNLGMLVSTLTEKVTALEKKAVDR